jgi:hypothetical protein
MGLFHWGEAMGLEWMLHEGRRDPESPACVRQATSP